mmetsp:Transcript_30618/g.99523  ORF Transcript_30618/g.99523 Transcript_30618/m.99523 type:complete len:228 (-) Transcript_30618:15-698(-)
MNAKPTNPNASSSHDCCAGWARRSARPPCPPSPSTTTIRASTGSAPPTSAPSPRPTPSTIARNGRTRARRPSLPKVHKTHGATRDQNLNIIYTAETDGMAVSPTLQTFVASEGGDEIGVNRAIKDAGLALRNDDDGVPLSRAIAVDHHLFPPALRLVAPEPFDVEKDAPGHRPRNPRSRPEQQYRERVSHGCARRELHTAVAVPANDAPLFAIGSSSSQLLCLPPSL